MSWSKDLKTIESVNRILSLKRHAENTFIQMWHQMFNYKYRKCFLFLDNELLDFSLAYCHISSSNSNATAQQQFKDAVEYIKDLKHRKEGTS